MLDELRNKIDTLDDELVRILEERLGLLNQVAEYKREHHLGVKDSIREEMIIERLNQNLRGKDYQNEIIALMNKIFETSRDIQRNYLLK